MGIVLRQSVKTTTITFAGAILGALTIYLSTKYIPGQGYGFSKTILTHALLASQFTLVGMHSSLHIYMNRYPAADDRRKVLFTFSMIIPVIVTALASLIYIACKNGYISLYTVQDQPYLEKFFYWLPIYTLLWTVMTLLEYYLLAHMKVALSNFVKEIILRISNILLVVLFAVNIINFDWFIILSVLIHLVPIAAYLYIGSKQEDFGFSINWKIFPKNEIREIASFSIFHLFMNVTITAMYYIDQLMLGILDKTGFVSVAVYSVAMYIISVFQIPIRAIAVSIIPTFTHASEEGDEKKLDALFKKSASTVLITICGMAILILCNMHNAVKLFDPSYAPMYLIVPIVLLGRFIDSATGLNTELLSVSRYYRFNFFVTLVLLALTVIFNYILIPRYGVYGAAWANTIAFASFNIGKFLFIWLKMKHQPFTGKSPIIILAALPAALAGYLIPHIQNPFADTFVRSGIILILFGIAVYLLKASEEFNQMIKNLKEKKRLY